jgi:hypothetical protein
MGWVDGWAEREGTGGRRDGWMAGWVDGWMGGWVGGGMGGWVGGGMGGRSERARGECGFSSLVKLKKKGKNYADFYFAGIYIYIYIYIYMM